MNDDSAFWPRETELAEDVLRMLERRRRPRGATYRLQFQRAFTYPHASAILPYLQRLGVTHVYSSPQWPALPGSMHGYDVCRHDQLNPELGDGADYADYVETLKQLGLGQILDIVPNHMAASCHNPWWCDVLENGPSSPYARYFDIDWKPLKAELENKVLLPILGDHYGEVLESGQLRIEHAEGAFFLRCYDQRLPLSPETSKPILQHGRDQLQQQLSDAAEAFVEYQSILTALEYLPPQTVTTGDAIQERQREKEVIKRRLKRLEEEEPAIAESIAATLDEFNGRVGEPPSFRQLDQLLNIQAYRLSHWRAAADEVNYRRFFDVSGLTALCMEAVDVYEATHRLVLQLLGRGDIDGFRVDHIDGLLDPTQYLWRLQWSYLDELGRRAYCRRVQAARPSLAAVEAGANHAATENFLEPAECEDPANLPPEAPPWPEVRRDVLQVLSRWLRMPLPDQDWMEMTVHDVERRDNRYSPSPPSTRDVYHQRIHDVRQLPLYVLVEKILGPNEPLPLNWPVAGTSGYDFLQLVNGLFVEPKGLQEIQQAYARFVGEKLNFDETVYRCKKLVLRFLMASELQLLAHRLNLISEQRIYTRDFTLNGLRYALREILACFPVYRTYAGPSYIADRDRAFIDMAIKKARRLHPSIDSALFDFIRRVLLLQMPDDIDDEGRRQREFFTGRFQQVTSPVMAKGVEDTAFYVYCPLVSVNDVGCHPDDPAVSVERFHQENIERRKQYAQTMLATSTHDTKRSEDVRARMNVLSEISQPWRQALARWSRLNRRFLHEVDGLPAPSRSDEHLIYQTLVGMWPIHELDAAEHEQVVRRLQAYMEKATHEAKLRTSWLNPNPEYDQAVRDFVARILEPRKDNRFLQQLRQFHERFADCGLYTALSQAALKLVSPGIPDVYQGQEVWDFSLVDPDNRRPVDYQQRQAWLDELEARFAAGPESRRELALELARQPRDSRLKLLLTWRLLQLRRNHPQLFTEGEYIPLEAQGPAARHVCALAWREHAEPLRGRGVIVVVPRFLAQLAGRNQESEIRHRLLAAETWGDTSVALPFEPDQWQHAITGRTLEVGDSLSLAELFQDFPVAVLTIGCDA